jgi:hypothetical protein
MGTLAARIADKVHPHRADAPGGGVPVRLTEERPFYELKGSLVGLEVGVTVSELHQLRARDGVEVIHVVNADGSSSVETVLARKELGRGQRVELQGPALSAGLAPGAFPLGARFVGVGLTSDLVDEASKEAVSYTVEVKLTDRSVAELATLAAPGAAAEASRLLAESSALEGVGAVVAEAFAGAVPVVSALIAFSTARWALGVVRDPEASLATKAIAVGHALSDGARILFPIAGTLGNAALVGVSALIGLHEARKAAARATPPTGPPPAVDGETAPPAGRTG